MAAIAQNLDLSVPTEPLAASHSYYRKKKRVNSPAASKRSKPSNKVKDDDEFVRRRKSRKHDLASCPGVRWYRARRGDPNSKAIHEHRFWFRGTSFNLDGTGWKTQTAPENLSFVERVKSNQLPDEFEAVGLYNVRVEYLPLGMELGPGDLQEDYQILKTTGVDDNGHPYYLDCEDYISSDNDEFREFRRKIWYKKEEEKLRKELADYD